MISKNIYLVLISLVFIASSCTTEKLFKNENGLTMMSAAPIKWYLTFPTCKFQFVNKMKKPDNSGTYFMFSNYETGVSVSFFLDSAGKCKSSECLRDVAWIKQKDNLEGASNILLSSIGDAYSYEYLLPKVYNYYNLHVNLYKDGYWVDIHLSKLNYSEKDRYLFTDFISSLSFQPKINTKQ